MKTAAVTGATSGIGFAVCEELLKRGYYVIGVGHSEENAHRAETRLREAAPGNRVDFVWGDLTQRASVLRAAGEVKKLLIRTSDGRLDALVSNAGCVRSWYMTTAEGYEQQFALNYLAGFLLTHELLENLLASRGRILITSSGSHKMMKMNWTDLMYQKRYHPLLAYKQSKLACMLFARALNDRYAASGLRAYGMDPGLVATDIGLKKTGKLVGTVWKLRKKHGVDPSAPAKVYASVVDAEKPMAALSYGLGGEQRISREVSRENADRLFDMSEALCHIRFGVTEE